MTDIVERLLRVTENLHADGYAIGEVIVAEAADLIEVQRDEIERLREAIRLALRCTPFIAVDDDGVPTIQHDCGDPWDILIKALENKP